MTRFHIFLWFIKTAICFTLISSAAAAADAVVVVPLGGAIGDATSADVLTGKTFSSAAAGKGITGTLEIREGSGIISNSIGMQFSLIPAGSFVMGSPDGSSPAWWPAEAGRETDETQHIVILSDDFYMQTTEVTQEQWEQVMGSNPSGNSGCDTCPVEEVSWDDALDFIAALNALEGKTGCGISPNSCYSLPTEAQWEYAARGGNITAFYSGGIAGTFPDVNHCDTPQPNLDRIGWYVCNSNNQTHPVAQKEPNNFGLYDTSGNVWEWCQDLYDTGTNHVIRGGSWRDPADGLRSADRAEHLPGDHIGFRVILSVPSQ